MMLTQCTYKSTVLKATLLLNLLSKGKTMAKNNNYGNYILSDAPVDYKLFGYNKRDLTQYKHQFVSKNKLTIQYLDIHVERLNPNPYIRNLPFYKTVCDICGNTFWRKKSYDKYKRNMCGYKCQGDALYNSVKKEPLKTLVLIAMDILAL